MNYELKRWKEKYTEELFAAISGSEICGCISDWIPSPYTRDDAERFIKARMYGDEENELCRAIIVDSKPVGSVEIYKREGCFAQKASLFFWISNEYANEDIIANVLKELCEKALSQFDICRVEAVAFEEDLQARAALNDAGFELEGVMQRCIIVEGELRSRCVYALVSNELYTD